VSGRREQAPLLTGPQKRSLVEVARAAIAAQVTGAPPPELAELPMPDASGAFVTVKVAGELRGCLGTLDCRDGLAREVARCAADAAAADRRFAPVSASELPAMSLDVSVLGPLEAVDSRSSDAIVVGRHGLVVEQGRRRGLLLPQVAAERGWTPDQFLRQTCRKAGLPPDAWQHGALVFRFEADVFGDNAD
jgi:AmmeMemoRadiSam system protein A